MRNKILYVFFYLHKELVLNQACICVLEVIKSQTPYMYCAQEGMQ